MVLNDAEIGYIRALVQEELARSRSHEADLGEFTDYRRLREYWAERSAILNAILGKLESMGATDA